MLFMLDSKHSAETCPAGVIHPDKDWARKFDEAVKASGAKMVAGYLDAAGHHFYFLIEAETAEQLYALAVPHLVGIGDTKTVPVAEWGQAKTVARNIGAQR
jgi:Domain of unknown function (DUF3303)